MLVITGRWTTWCDVNDGFEVKNCRLSLIDEEEQDKRTNELKSGYILFGRKRYEWSKL